MSVKQEQFFTWLSKEVPYSQMADFYFIVSDLENYAHKKGLFSGSLFDVGDSSITGNLFNLVKSDIPFRRKNKKDIKIITSLAGYYHDYTKSQSLTPTTPPIFSKAVTPAANEMTSTTEKSINAIQNSSKSTNIIDKVGDINSSDSVKQSRESGKDDYLISSNQIEDQASEQIVDFENGSDYSFSRPISLSYFGDVSFETSWRKIYIKACQLLIEDYPEDFKILRQYKGSKSSVYRLIADKFDSRRFTTPVRIEENFYVETNRSATVLMRNLKALLDYCRVDYENVVIRYEKIQERKSTLGKAVKLETTTTKKSSQLVHEEVSNDALVEYCNRVGLDFLDCRQKLGCFWVIGSQALSDQMKALQEIGVRMQFKAGGGKATGGQDAWWTKDYASVPVEWVSKLINTDDGFPERKSGLIEKSVPQDIKEKFISWLKSNNINENSAKTIAEVIEKVSTFAVTQGMLSYPLFNISDEKEAICIIGQLEDSKRYVEYQHYNPAVHFATKKYLTFWKEFEEDHDGLNKDEQDEKLATSISERKYKRDDKEDFYQWMLKDQHMAVTSCRGYVSAIRVAEKYAEEHSFGSVALLGVTAEEARTTADSLFGDAEFIEKNEAQHNRFRAAITKLLAYLGEDWTLPDMTSSAKGTNTIPNKDIIQVNVKPYEAVLIQKFPHGYRLGSSIEMKKFRRFFEEMNGYALEQESDEVKKMISLCGIEHEGRVFAPDSMLSEELRDKLFDFIDKYFEEGKKVVYYEALFREFSEDFLDQNIYDSEMLKTYITHMAGDRYFMARSYLSNERLSSVDPIDDVRTCLKEHGLPMEVDDLCKTLSHIPSDRVRMLLRTHGEFVRNSKGEYFHIDSFSVLDEELENIIALINEEIKNHSFISGHELYNAIKGKYPYVYEKNAMFSVIGWRDAFKYKLGDRFSFTGNIISSKDKELSMSDVFATYGAEQERFTLSEILAFAENMGSTIYFDALYQNSARVSQEHFVSRDEVWFRVKETDEALGRFCTGNYLALSKITDFGILPEASHPWTLYLLEHYVAFHSKLYYLMHGGYNRNTVVGAMVKKEIVYDSFDDLIVDVIAESGISLQKKDVLNYLSNNGFIARRTYTGIEVIMIKARAKRNKREK